MIPIGIGLALDVLIFIGYLLGGVGVLVGVGLAVLASFAIFSFLLMGGAPVVGDADEGEE